VSPDDFNTIMYRLDRLERNMEKVETQRLPDMLAQGRSWHSSMLTAVAELERRVMSLPEHLDTRYILKALADERYVESQKRLVQLEAKSETCMSRPDAIEQHRVLSEAVLKLEARMTRELDDHRDEHRQANTEHTTMQRWLAGTAITAGSAMVGLIGLIVKFTGDGHT
jgi:Mg2+ and Co2+ transporter CorA